MAELEVTSTWKSALQIPAHQKWRHHWPCILPSILLNPIPSLMSPNLCFHCYFCQLWMPAINPMHWRINLGNARSRHIARPCGGAKSDLNLAWQRCQEWRHHFLLNPKPSFVSLNLCCLHSFCQLMMPANNSGHGRVKLREGDELQDPMVELEGTSTCQGA